jgi:nucleoside-diphosphate-sugar epimerase
MHQILITGGAGFIGQHLLKRLCQLNCKVTIIDNLSNANANFQIDNILSSSSSPAPQVSNVASGKSISINNVTQNNDQNFWT